MGTRNLTMVQVGGKIKVAQYGQWDGYPEGQGERVYEFITTADMNHFKWQIDKTYFTVDGSPMDIKVERAFNAFNKQYNKILKLKDYDNANEKAAANLPPKQRFLYSLFTRDTGANILKLIYGAVGEKQIPLANNIDFAGDSLFCEWAYLLNLDTDTLEVYKGFNKEVLTKDDRFYGAPLDNPEYKQIRLLKTFKFNRMPKTVKHFTTVLNRLGNKRDKERKSK